MYNTEDTELAPVEFSYTVVEPYLQRMEETHTAIADGINIYSDIRLKSKGKPASYKKQVVSAERHYCIMKWQLYNIMRWAQGYVILEQGQASFDDFNNMHRKLLKHLAVLEDIINAKTSGLTNNPEHARNLRLGEQEIKDFYTKFIMEVVNPAANKYIKERVGF